MKWAMAYNPCSVANTPHDVFEAIFSTAVGTGHLVVRVGVRDSFRRALARAAEDCVCSMRVRDPEETLAVIAAIVACQK